MRLERRAPGISLVEVECIAVVWVTRDAVVDDARLGRRETGCFCVDLF